MIEEIQSHFPKRVCAYLLKKIFDNKELWERRTDRTVGYRNGEWFTMGAPLYLDLPSKEVYSDYLKKVEYFNHVFQIKFHELFEGFKHFFPESSEYLAESYSGISLPGFHLFPPFETFAHFFGKKHRDLQWKSLPLLPDFPFKEEDMTEHFSFTYVLKAPFTGASMYLWDKDGTRSTFEYEENRCYTHDGTQEHAIAPFENPILPGDWRITFQGHGFKANNIKYLYW